MAGELESFLESGIYRLEGSNALFVDPVRLLNHSYTRFRVSPSAYYSRCFDSPSKGGVQEEEPEGPKKRKRKKRKRSPRVLNERERAAEKRHQEARSLLVSAHKSFLEASDLLAFLPKLVKSDEFLHDKSAVEPNFVQLGNLWEAPLYDISLRLPTPIEGEDSWLGHQGGKTVLPLFNNLISNQTDDDVEAEFHNSCYILPSRSRFHMSDLRQIRNLISAQSDQGNLIVIDPPWENGSVHQKAAYPTLPNRYFLYLPVKELAHEEGSVVALWMTNREKLLVFVEKELFPAWGVVNATLFYWLKVKPDGTLIGDLDLFHHRPYECLLLGYINVGNVNAKCKPTFDFLKNSQVIISIPGAHSRKPPLGKLLLDHVPGPKPAKCLELFARELMAGWTSWGNEPLHFQNAKYFVEKT